MSRRRESGQALVLALLALLLASMAAGFVATDLAWRHRALQEEAARAHLRALLDGAFAEALARLDAGLSVIGEEREWGGRGTGGRTVADAIALGPRRYRVRVEASYAGRRGAVEALVATAPVRVERWGRVATSAPPRPLRNP